MRAAGCRSHLKRPPAVHKESAGRCKAEGPAAARDLLGVPNTAAAALAASRCHRAGTRGS